MELLDLYQFAENEHISVYCFDLPQVQSMSIMGSDGKCTVGIDPFELKTSQNEKVKLAHEIGHCTTGSFYNRYSDLDIIEKSERKADVWAIKKLIPEDELQEAFEQGIVEPWTLAEYFNVTEDFVIKAVDYYRNIQ